MNHKKQTGFAQLSPQLLEIWPYLKDRHRKVLPMILKHYPNMRPGIRAIEKSAQCSRDTVQRVIHELHHLGILLKENRQSHRGDNTSNAYHLGNLDDPQTLRSILDKLQDPDVWKKFSRSTKLSNKQTGQDQPADPVPPQSSTGRDNSDNHESVHPVPPQSSTPLYRHGSEHKVTSIRRKKIKANGGPCSFTSDADLLDDKLLNHDGDSLSTDSLISDEDLTVEPDTDLDAMVEAAEVPMDMTLGASIDSSSTLKSSTVQSSNMEGVQPDTDLDSTVQPVNDSCDTDDRLNRDPSSRGKNPELASIHTREELEKRLAARHAQRGQEAPAERLTPTPSETNGALSAPSTGAVEPSNVEPASQADSTPDQQPKSRGISLSHLATLAEQSVTEELEPSDAQPVASGCPCFPRHKLPIHLSHDYAQPLMMFSIGQAPSSSSESLMLPQEMYQIRMELRVQQMKYHDALRRSNEPRYCELQNLLEDAGIQKDNIASAIDTIIVHAYSLSEVQALLAETKARKNVRDLGAIMLRRLVDGDRIGQPKGFDPHDSSHEHNLQEVNSWFHEFDIVGRGRQKLLNEHFSKLCEMASYGLDLYRELEEFREQYQLRKECPAGVIVDMMNNKLSAYLDYRLKQCQRIKGNKRQVPEVVAS